MLLISAMCVAKHWQVNQKVLTEASLAFDQGDQHHCPQERSGDESGDLTGRLKQVAVFSLKCFLCCPLLWVDLPFWNPLCLCGAKCVLHPFGGTVELLMLRAGGQRVLPSMVTL